MRGNAKAWPHLSAVRGGCGALDFAEREGMCRSVVSNEGWDACMGTNGQASLIRLLFLAWLAVNLNPPIPAPPPSAHRQKATPKQAGRCSGTAPRPLPRRASENARPKGAVSVPRWRFCGRECHPWTLLRHEDRAFSSAAAPSRLPRSRRSCSVGNFVTIRSRRFGKQATTPRPGAR
ncbi:uncharacterized protein K460DRAFT_391186 [Cucurbitaria berberidis CBS 394.84]|uniref:Uncharacterized protein n=1 Tax=Cucurbitaria berberidis CBS 394.84 TaxID=1168544 RepID=A0A9P4GQC4_9PLEO|nr:uncharacterized protein K460DRAFT_391186 [Cucurbitaria berberidis CBS 394.84]KAF1850758.1 hypothetical protein K460DRAFT_391186 [Cucurbitaria berberidis CBS 394.84]